MRHINEVSYYRVLDCRGETILELVKLMYIIFPLGTGNLKPCLHALFEMVNI